MKQQMLGRTIEVKGIHRETLLKMDESPIPRFNRPVPLVYGIIKPVKALSNTKRIYR
jgi:hypothetical protein